VTAATYIFVSDKVSVMKEYETKARFIELRGHGLPLKRIADEIGVSKTTLVNWEQDHKERVDNVQVMELEALDEKYYLSVRKKVEFLVTCSADSERT
jgi:transcriptional regulator with XRE-family HTH domain